jgi:hypothetical protein
VDPIQVADYIWELPVGYVDGMRVPGRVFASEELFAKAVEDRAVEQVANVATLPGIVGSPATGVMASGALTISGIGIVIPEPATVALLCIGGLMVVGLGRRRARGFEKSV